MANKTLAGLIIAPNIVGAIVVSEAPADQSSMEHLLGDYQGVSVEDPSETWSPTDLDVSTQRTGENQLAAEATLIIITPATTAMTPASKRRVNTSCPNDAAIRNVNKG